MFIDIHSWLYIPIYIYVYTCSYVIKRKHTHIYRIYNSRTQPTVVHTQRERVVNNTIITTIIVIGMRRE